MSTPTLPSPTVSTPPADLVELATATPGAYGVSAAASELGGIPILVLIPVVLILMFVSLLTSRRRR